MKIGIIGLPQAGKRTFFSLLTGRQVPETRKPGESLEGVARIADPRVDTLSGICKPRKTVYAENRFVLCPDVVEGAGSRDWLDSARRCDLLCLVVRAFTSDAVYHPAGSVDAGRDLAGLRAELLLADMEICDKRLARLAKEKRAGMTPAQAREEEVLAKCMAALEADTPLYDVELSESELAAIGSLEFTSILPQLVVRNVDEDGLAEAADTRGELAVSCLIEQELAALEGDEQREYLAALGLERPGLERVNAAAYEALGLMSFYTAGEDEVRAWTIRRGSTAPVAGGKIHSDIQRGFIRVEVIHYDDFVEAGSEKAARDNGRLQLKGKDYMMEDGCVCHFLFNV